MPNDSETLGETGRFSQGQSKPNKETQQLTSEEKKKESFAKRLTALKIHPILIFGVSTAGKSMLLASLIHHRRSANGAGASPLGQRPEESPFRIDEIPADTANDREENCQKFYNVTIGKLLAGEKPDLTNVKDPFFIQLSTKFGDLNQPDRIAFMEGNGEWYHLRANQYEPLKWEIDAILQYFHNPISVLFVAPKRFTSEKAAIDADLALENCVQAYARSRTGKSKDNLLFVISKWDSGCSADDYGAADSAFNNPTLDQCLETLKNPDLAWGAFKNLPIPDGKRMMTPHSAAIFNDRTGEIDAVLNQRSAPALDNFDRVIWDWLGENIFEQQGKSRIDYHPVQGDPGKMKIYGYDRLAWQVLSLRQPKKSSGDTRKDAA